MGSVARLRARAGTVVACAAAAVIAGCGGAPAGNPDADPAKLAPASSPVYVGAVVDPRGDLGAATRSAAGRILHARDPGARIVGLLDRIGDRDCPRGFSRDIEPWLGRRAGIFVSSIGGGRPAAAGVVTTRDRDRAAEDLRRDLRCGHGGRILERSYRGVSYEQRGEIAEALVGDYVVVGNPAGLRAAVDTARGGPHLAASRAYHAALATLPAGHRLAVSYADTAQLVQAVIEARGGGGFQNASDAPAASPLPLPLPLGNLPPLAAALNVSPDRLTLDLAVRSARRPAAGLASPGRGALIGALPGDSWLAFGAGGLGPQLRAQLGNNPNLAQLEALLRARAGIDLNRDVAAWTEDLALFARGSTPAGLQAGVVLSSRDRPASHRALIDIVAALVTRAHLRPQPLPAGPGMRGFRLVGAPGRPPFELAVAGDRFVAAYGAGSARAALRPTTRLSDAPSFRAATRTLGTGAPPALVVEVAPILRLAEADGATRHPGFRSALPYLQALRSIVAGGGRDRGVARTRLAAGLR